MRPKSLNPEPASLYVAPQVDVHMISFNWEQKSEQRLLQAGDAVLSLDTRANELGESAGILYQAEILDTRPSSQSVSLRFHTHFLVCVVRVLPASRRLLFRNLLVAFHDLCVNGRSTPIPRLTHRD